MKLILGDCLDKLRDMPDNSTDAIVTDPPYGLSFMGKKWDYDVPSVAVWRECLRVLKPGGHALIACGTRTQHRMAVNIEDAGFEIRDVITWLYGSGFPKSLNISKAIDKANGDVREKIGLAGKSKIGGGDICTTGMSGGEYFHSSAASAAWDGFGTALKPAVEFWTLARKPLSEKTVAKNVLKHGTGGINIDGCRIATDECLGRENPKPSTFVAKIHEVYVDNTKGLGRFPANLILDEEAASLLDEQSGLAKPKAGREGKRGGKGFGFFDDAKSKNENGVWPVDNGGGASRFFYVAKASKSERNAGLESLPDMPVHRLGQGLDPNAPSIDKNFHPTVKPIKLMRYLCKLITPPNGIVLDPFMGSGSTGVAAKQEGFDFIGIERDAEYFKICEKRIL